MAARKEGDAKDAPAPLAFAERWAMGKPDAVIEMAAAYDVPAQAIAPICPR